MSTSSSLPFKPVFVESLEGRRLLAGVAVDPGFGTDGRAVIDTAAAAALRADYESGLLLLPDGKLIVAGTSDGAGSGSGMIRRLNADGSVDPTFGHGGTTLLRFQGGGSTVGAIKQADNGKFVVVGSTVTNVNSLISRTGYITRLNADGSLDTTFGAGGTLQLGTLISTPEDVIVLPDGKIVIAGTSGGAYDTPYGAVARVSAKGLLDSTFGTAGQILLANTANNFLSNLTLISPTRFIVYSTNRLFTFDNASGNLLSSVSTNGLQVNEVRRLADGGLAAVGQYNVPASNTSYPVFAKLTADGLLDTTAFAGGMVPLKTGVNSYRYGSSTFVQLADGSFVVSVSGVLYESPARLLKISPAGVIDAGFAETGSYIDPLDSSLRGGIDTGLADSVLDAQGRLIGAAGSYYGPPADGWNETLNIVLTRYLIDMGLTPQVALPTTPVAQGETFTASAAGTISNSQSVTRYEWDADYTLGGSFDVDATGETVSLVARRAPTSTIGLRITTADGASAIFTRSLQVADVAPTLSAGAPVVGPLGSPLPIAFTVTDPGDTSFTLKINYGAGGGDQTILDWKPGTPVTYTYNSVANYTARVTVTDAGGLSASTTIPVTVQPLTGTVVDSGANNAPMAGVTVFVDSDRNGLPGNTEVKTVTDANGTFSLFSASTFGISLLGIVLPTDYSFVGQTADLQFTAATWGNRVLRLAKVTTLSGVVYADQNGDNIADTPLAPIANATVWADLDNNALLDPGEPAGVTTSTGSYTLSLPGSGSYVVRVSGSPQLDTTAGSVATYTLTQYQRQTGATLLAKKKATGSLKVVAFLDTNENGVQDSGESAVSSLKGSFAYANYPGTSATALSTGTDGTATLTGLPLNLVTVSMDFADTFIPSTASTLATQTVQLLAGTTTVIYGLTLAQPFGSVSGRMFEDVNGDGVYSTNNQYGGEPSLSFKAYLDLNDNGQYDSTEPFSRSSGSTYTIPYVLPGTYRLRVVESNSYIYPGNADGRLVTVTANQALTGIDLPMTNTNPRVYQADISGATQVAEGQTVMLGGYGQLHNVEIVTFEWDLDYAGGPFVTDATGYQLLIGGESVDGSRSRLIAGRSVDSQGRRSSIAFFTIDVLNMPPTATFTSGPAAALGTASSVGFSNATDPSAADRAGLTYSYDFNNDGDFTDDADILNSTSPLASFTSAIAGSFTVHGRVADKDGGISDYYATLTVTPPAWLSASADAGYSLSGNTLSVSAGIVTLLSDPSSVLPGLSVLISGTGRVTAKTSVHLAALDLSAQGSLTIAAGGDKVLRVSQLNLQATSRLDLNDNDLVFDYDFGEPAADKVRAMIAMAWAGGAWTGVGLTSALAENDASRRTSIGYVEASVLAALPNSRPVLGGEVLDSNTIVVRRTLIGDADFNDVVDFNDFLTLQNGFGRPGSFWQGDFDVSGQVDFNDFLALQNNYGQRLAVTSPSVTEPKPGDVESGSITGLVYRDNNRNGKYDRGDGASKNVLVYLDLDGDGSRDVNEPTATTDRAGRYTFVGLKAGRYVIRPVLPTGTTATTPARTLILDKAKAGKAASIGITVGR